jgi:hypothetical protein
MKNPLQELIGLRVTKAEVVQEYLHLSFGDQVALSAANDYTVNGTKDLAQLHNLALLDASQDASQITLVFENAITLNVSLLPEAYHGPEAVVLTRVGKPIVVWN